MNTIIEQLDILIALESKNNNSSINNYLSENLINNILLNISKRSLFSNSLSEGYKKSIVQNHINYLKEIFHLKDANVIYEHFLWEINTYKKVGFNKLFFKTLIEIILEELKKIEDQKIKSLVEFYNVLNANFELLYKNAQEFIHSDKTPKQSKHIFKNFLNALLNSDINEAVNISNDFIKDKKDLKIFWEDIILSALYTIGSMWANGKISVGQEHTATSICQRVMSLHYEKILENMEFKKKILVAVSTNELHEVGARMIADLLEFNKYDTYFFGSKSSIEEISNTLINENIKDILISTTLVSNIDETKKMIDEIKEKAKIDDLKIYIGGQAFNNIKNKIDYMNVDYYVSSFDDLIKILEEKE